jgi:8-oxo-dGTP pyrophosphatase MutT (NUDIX family)
MGMFSFVFSLIIVRFGETPAQCASRELLEETALVAEQVEKGPWVNGILTLLNFT